MPQRLTLRAGDLQVDLAPEIGGSVAAFERITARGRQALMRGGGPGASDAVDMASFPLVPYLNRIRGGRFDCDGRTVTLAPNMAGDASPLHGQGWRAAWRVTAAGDAHASLAFDHEAAEWPWHYTATQDFRLDPAGLTMTLSCTNRSPQRMPCGLGFHPAYPCNGDTLLDTEVESVWTVDAAVLPVENVPATGRYDLRNRRICSQGLDNGFDGWGGSAIIRWPGEPAGLRLSSPDSARFQVYSPTSGGLFVAEPVQHANAAMNAPQAEWQSLGLELLAQGETRSITARFDVLVD